MRNRNCIVALIAGFMAIPVSAAPALGDTQLKQMPSIQQTSPTLQSGKTLMINLKPELTTFSPTDCVNKGGRLVVNGRNLGSRSGRGIALGGNGVHVDLNVSSWSSTSIVTTVPNDNRLIAGKTYYAGVEKSDHSEWLSNFANGIKICSGGGSGGLIIDRNLADKVIDSPGIKPAGGGITLSSSSSSSSSSSRSHAPLEEVRSGDRGSSSSRDYEPIEEVRSDERESGSGGGATRRDDTDDQGDEYWYDYDEPAPAAPVTPSQQVTPDRSGSLMGRGVPPAPQLPKAAQRDKDESQYEPGQVVVITASMEESMELGRQLMQQGVRIKTRTPLNNLGLVLNVLRLPQGMDVQQAIGVLRESYTGLWVDTNQRFRLMSSDRKRSAQNLIGWRAQPLNCADSLRIGMVDTAVDTNHEALSGQAVTTKNFLRRGAAGSDHGTAVAALLIGNRTGEYAGLLPEAHLFAAEVFRERDDQTETTAEWLIRGIDWLLGHRVDVVNLSLGGPRNLVVELAIQRTLERGAGVVAAAGNGGTGTNPVYPAAHDGVIAVTAVDARRSIYGDASRGDYIDLAAPGVDVWVAEGHGSGAYRSGTSYAAPFVSAVAATWRSKHRGESMLDPVKNVAMDLGRPGKDPVYGWGLVQWKTGCN